MPLLPVTHRKRGSSKAAPSQGVTMWRLLRLGLVAFLALQAVLVAAYFVKASKRRASAADGSGGGDAGGGSAAGSGDAAAAGAGQEAAAGGGESANGGSGGGADDDSSAARRLSSLLVTTERRKKKKEVTPGALMLRALQLEARLASVPEFGGAAAPLSVDETDVFPPGNEDEACVGRTPADMEGIIAAVVTVTFDREEYLERMLQGLLEVHGSDEGNARAFPLFISQDFDDPAVQDVIYRHLGKVKYLQHLELAPPVPEFKKEKIVYIRIANHYKFIFQTFFDCFGYERLIILEDDMQLAPDFFPFFEATAPLLDRDPTLFCVSSWNDHGQDRFVRDARRLYRSDFFPGLGWMTNRATWDSIKASWPRGYWDDWMRLNSTRRGRQCMRPEICRNYNFGEHGSSAGQFYRQFLKPIRLNNETVPWREMDLSYLEPESYSRDFAATLAAAAPVNTSDAAWNAETDVVYFYNTVKEYERFAMRLRMMRDWKDGIPRGSYRGVVAVRNANGVLLFVAPSPSFNTSEPAAPAEPEPPAWTGALTINRLFAGSKFKV